MNLNFKCGIIKTDNYKPKVVLIACAYQYLNWVKI
jgi:hypothetical protein